MLYACEILFPCLEGNGVITTENRSVSSFTTVNNASEFDVIIEYSANATISVKADENLQQYIRTYVQNGELILETDQDRCLQPQEPIAVTVYCPYLESVILSGSGDIDMYDITSDYLNLTLSGSGDINASNIIATNSLEMNLGGSGDITIDGKAANAQYYLTGSGDIHGEMMRADKCSIVLSGSGDVYTYVYTSLKIVLSGSGNVYYYGDPEEIEQRVTGSGVVIKK